MSARVLTRSQWGFAGPLGPARVQNPARGWWLHHSVTAPSSDPRADMRRLERIGRERFGRLSYSHAYHVGARTFLQGQDEWIGAHTGGQNSTTKGLVLIGNYDASRLPGYVTDDIAWFIDRERATTQPDLLGGHRDAPGASTVCPGRHGQALIPTIRSLIDEDDMPLNEADKRWILSALSTTSQVENVKHTWNRFAVRDTSGELVPLVTALQLIYRRLEDPTFLAKSIAAVIEPGEVNEQAVERAIRRVYAQLADGS